MLHRIGAPSLTYDSLAVHEFVIRHMRLIGKGMHADTFWINTHMSI